MLPEGIAVAPNGTVYVGGPTLERVQYFTATGEYRGVFGWQAFKWWRPVGIAVAPNANVYIADCDNNQVEYFTSTGSFIRKWGNARLRAPRDLDVAPNGNVYVADTWHSCIQYFTPSGSFLGKWGTEGSANGQFRFISGVALSPTGARIYVLDHDNHRVQYFNRNAPAVAPASLGRVKALFK